MKKQSTWKFLVGKVKGDAKAYGATDFANKTIEINKKYHKSKWNHKPGVRKNKNGTANITDTILHETLHKNHPRMTEKGIRKLTPLECARIQGFPINYKLPQIADSALYKQFGNSVSVPVIEAVGKQMMKAME